MSITEEPTVRSGVCEHLDVTGLTGYQRGCRCDRCTEAKRYDSRSYREKQRTPGTGVYIREPSYPPFPDRLRVEAACSTTDKAVFFPSADSGAVGDREAKRVCAGCPVQEGCRDWARGQSSLHGVWGGENETERRRIRRKAKGW